jgi:hypothetical protein
LALGWSLDEATSWVLTRATYDAAAKCRFRRQRNGTGERPAHPANAPSPHQRYESGGELASRAHGTRHPLRFQLGEEARTRAAPDRKIVRRLPDWERAWADAQAVIATADRQNLESQHRCFAEVFKPRRDKLATRWST